MHEPDELRDEEPDGRALTLDDLDQVERAAHDHDAEDAERERHLVGDELRAGAHRAEHRELRVGGPAADDEAVDADRAEREDDEQPDRQIGDRALDVVAVDRPARPPRDDREREQGGEARHDRREDVRQLVGGGGVESLLADELDQVGDRLEQAERAGAVRAVAELHPSEHLSLEPGRVGEGGHDQVDHDRHRDDRDPPRLGHGDTLTWVTSTRLVQPGRVLARDAHGAGGRSPEMRARSVTDVPFERDLDDVALRDLSGPRVRAGQLDLAVAALEVELGRALDRRAREERLERQEPERPSPTRRASAAGCRRCARGSRGPGAAAVSPISPKAMPP